MIEVKNIKHSASLSEETLAYTASVYFNGKKIADAKNHGHGGMTFIHQTKGNLGTLREAEKYAETLPPYVSKFMPDDPLPMTLDSHVDDLVARFLDERDWKRRCKTKTYFLLKGDDTNDGWRYVNRPYSETILDWLVNKYGDQIDVIKNEEYI